METERLLIFAVELLKIGNDEKASNKIEVAKELDEDNIFESYTEQLYLELEEEDQEIAVKFKEMYSKYLTQEQIKPSALKQEPTYKEEKPKPVEKQVVIEEEKPIDNSEQSEEQDYVKSPLLIKWLVIAILIFMVLYVFNLLLATN